MTIALGQALIQFELVANVVGIMSATIVDMSATIVDLGQILILLKLVANVLVIMSATIVDPGQALILLKHVAKVLGITVSYQTLLRWVQKGVGGERLAASKIGGRWFVDPADLQAFVERLNARPDRTPLTVRPARSAGRKSIGVSKSSRGAAAGDTEEKLNEIFGPRRQNQQPGKEG